MTATQAAAPASDLDPAILREAAEWLVRLHSGDASAADYQALQRWLAQSAQHQQAWCRAEALLGNLQQIPPTLARATLDRPGHAASAGRRAALARLVWLPLLPASAWLGWEHLPWREWNADYRTATGEQQRATLADGTQVLLNTASALDVRYSGTQRLLHLLAGEVLITTAPDPAAHAGQPPRPFIVHTAEGRIRALGTRFTVRREAPGGGQGGARSHVAVFEGAVEITAGGDTRRIATGEQARFGATGITAHQVADEALDGAWSTGMLIARQMRLADLAAELNRYRPGVLRCAPEVADLRISGAFPLLEPERSLRLLVDTFPVQVRYRSRYWATLEPA